MIIRVYTEEEIREALSEVGVGAGDTDEVMCYLSMLPSAQPEIIRCKDCKYRDDDDFCTGRGYPNVLVPDDGFCDKGERRTDG